MPARHPSRAVRPRPFGRFSVSIRVSGRCTAMTWCSRLIVTERATRSSSSRCAAAASGSGLCTHASSAWHGNCRLLRLRRADARGSGAGAVARWRVSNRLWVWDTSGTRPRRAGSAGTMSGAVLFTREEFRMTGASDPAVPVVPAFVHPLVASLATVPPDDLAARAVVRVVRVGGSHPAPRRFVHFRDLLPIRVTRLVGCSTLCVSSLAPSPPVDRQEP